MPLGDILDLSSFEAYIQIFAGANIAWAGSKTFREAFAALSKQVKQAEIIAAQKFKTLQENVEQRKYKEIILPDVLKDIADIKDLQENLKKDIKRDEEFTLLFKKMFLMTAGFCLSILLLGAFQKRLSVGAFGSVLFGMDIILLCNIFILIRSWSFKTQIKQLKQWTPLIFTGLCALLSSIVFRFFSQFFNATFDNALIIITLITAPSPFLFHFIRALVHNYFFFQRTSAIVDKIDHVLELNNEIMHRFDNIDNQGNLPSSSNPIT